ncbi:MAG TPA: MmgE/PrpD family protein [Rhizobiales bacterium]|nr:MmgE/PrpD family protein [Hyphomicrobiales bacterium]
MATLTRQLVKLIAEKPCTNTDLQTAHLFLADAGANMIAGRNSLAGRKLLTWARKIAPDNNINRLDPARKAFLLGSLCHILEVDDLHRASVVHPGCVVAPVIFAMAGQHTRRQGLFAFLKGLEATTRLGMAVGPEHYRIWHNTATCGPFGSALAAAHLLDLDEDQIVHALGNAGSQASGFWQFLDASAETKHMHAGRAAEAGFVATQLAQQGFTGAPDILEGARGFFRATCKNPPVQNLLSSPDAPWQVHKNSIKPWPSCRHTHPAIQASLALHKKLCHRLQDIVSIEVTTYQAALDLCDRPRPETVYGAKFSLQHCIATALQTGIVDLAAFDPNARSQASGLAEKMVLCTGEDFETAYPDKWGSEITVKFTDGSHLTQATSSAKGDPDNPLSTSELEAKARQLLDYSGIQNPQKTLDQLLSQDDDAPLPDLVDLLSQSGP